MLESRLEVVEQIGARLTARLLNMQKDDFKSFSEQVSDVLYWILDYREDSGAEGSLTILDVIARAGDTEISRHGSARPGGRWARALKLARRSEGASPSRA